MTAGTGLSTFLDTRRARVELALERYLPSAPACPPIVGDAMRYSLFAGGKRLRSLLALASAEAVAACLGHSEDEASAITMPAACALEMIHTYSLIHDDLPAMDDDVLRRGRPTSHVVFGEGIAILAGDGLLTEALALMAREPVASPTISAAELAARKLGALQAVAIAAGATGMVGGQALDLAAVGRAGRATMAVDADALRAIHERKTAALIRASAIAGATMAGAPPTLLAAITDYGSELGLAFQIVDDVLDVEGASADLGKTAGKDAAAGKLTYPALYGLDESRRLAAACHDRALAALGRVGLAGQLPDIAHWIIGRTC